MSKYLRRSWNIDNTRRNGTACAGLRKSQGQSLIPQHIHNRFLQGLLSFKGKNIFAKTSFQFSYHRLDQLFTFLLILTLGCDPKMNLSGFGIWSKGRIGLCLDHILNIRSDLALADSADLHNLGADDLRLFLAKIRENRLLKHRDQLIGRSRKKDSGFAIFFKDQSRCCTVVVINYKSPLWYLCLLVIVGCDPSVRVIFLIFFHVALNTLAGMRILLKGQTHHLCADLFGQVILGRSKAAGKNYHI